MANSITSRRVPGTESIRMSNGLTSVLLDVLVLAGCDFARTPWEQKLVYWLATKDQTHIGLGMAGFDIAEMGIETDEQRAFVVRIVDTALGRHRWDALPFSPREEWITDVLGRLRALVAAVPAGRAEGGSGPEDLPTRGLCEVHRVYLHEVGCIICNETE